jgi:C4-dicarboxylate-specific signal transduction histidine kinase
MKGRTAMVIKSISFMFTAFVIMIFGLAISCTSIEKVETVEKAAEATAETAEEVTEATADTVEKAAEATAETAEKVTEATEKAAESKQ